MTSVLNKYGNECSEKVILSDGSIHFYKLCEIPVSTNIWHNAKRLMNIVTP